MNVSICIRPVALHLMLLSSAVMVAAAQANENRANENRANENRANENQANENQYSVWDGVYTPEQAQRGEQIYQDECQSCHAVDMRGGPAARGLLGLAFQYVWKDRTLGELFDAMRDQMPPGKPGSLDDQAYADVLAAVLRRNEFPDGARELEADPDALQSIVIRWDQKQ